MKNYVQPGDRLMAAAPYDVASGAGALVGVLFGVAESAALSGVSVMFAFTGVFDLTKVASQVWTVGAAIYWDNTNKYCTTTVGSNTLIGHAVAAVGSGAGETIGRVRLKV